jgi:hypothetical protein
VRNRHLVEVLHLESFLKLKRSAPSNHSHIRQFEFQIIEWEVAGISQLLSGPVGFCLSATPQPKSVGIAIRSDSDFPATIVYSGIYDVYVGKECVLTNQSGIGVGRGVMQIPPRGITVTFQKGFSIWGFDVGSSEYDSSADAAGQPVAMAECTTMTSVSPDEWEAGAARIRKMMR